MASASVTTAHFPQKNLAKNMFMGWSGVHLKKIPSAWSKIGRHIPTGQKVGLVNLNVSRWIGVMLVASDTAAYYVGRFEQQLRFPHFPQSNLAQKNT
jgi:hypothetical protein